MIIYNSTINIPSSQKKKHKYRNPVGRGINQTRRTKAKASPKKKCKVKKCKLKKKNIKYLKSLGLKVQVN